MRRQFISEAVLGTGKLLFSYQKSAVGQNQNTQNFALSRIT